MTGKSVYPSRGVRKAAPPLFGRGTGNAQVVLHSIVVVSIVP